MGRAARDVDVVWMPARFIGLECCSLVVHGRAASGATSLALLPIPFGVHPMTATATADLIPVRALNQVSYCERLYYLEYVESVMPTNEYVEEGLFHHRRV